MDREFPVKKVIGNYDGDTVTVLLDLGFNITIQKRCRLDNINTPEIRGGTIESKAKAKKARYLTKTWLKENIDGLYFVCTKWQGKYGRAIGDFHPKNFGDSLVKHLKENGF